jgi:uncharacterized protein (TIGR02302 family)
MSGPAPNDSLPPDREVVARLRSARLILGLESLWPALVWLASLAASFLALALFDLLPLLPGGLHAAILAIFAAFGLFLLRLMLRSKWPDQAAAARRLEQDSGLGHRPFQALGDRPALGDAALWDSHRQRLLDQVRRARLGWPRSDMAARDPWGLRAGALLLLAAALSGGGHDAFPRLARALDPALTLPAWGPDEVQVWITPPVYTGVAPQLLRPDQGDKAILVPAGSAVLAVASGGWGEVSLDVDGVAVPLPRLDDGSRRLETRIQAGTRLAIRHWGRDVTAWPLAVIADLSPAIDFAGAPEPAERGRLHMAVNAQDDYGLTRLWVEIRRLGAPVDETPLPVELPLAVGRGKQVASSSWHDLTAHPWAGMPVLAQPMAEDALGQRGAGEPMALTLPERSFLNPHARALIDQRRLVTESRTNAPGAMGIIDWLAVEPARFNNDMAAFLAMRLARHALSAPAFDLAEIQDLLWNAALRIEDGDLAAAEQRLEEARRALERGIDDHADAATLAGLLDQFQAALHRYLNALSERLGTPPADLESGAGAAIGAEELQDMVQAMRDLAAIGARDGMRQMLRNMAGILDGLQTRLPQAPSAAATQALRTLRDLAQRQQRLLEQSHRHSQPGAETPPPAASARRQQQELSQILDGARRQLMDGLGQEPLALDDAGQAMDQAAQSLGDDDWAGAAEAQTRALDTLSQGLRQSLDAMAAGALSMPGGLPRDPLGRPMGQGPGSGDDGATRVPDQAEARKARAIIDELRRRAGDFTRPQAERDYLQRLLRQF